MVIGMKRAVFSILMVLSVSVHARTQQDAPVETIRIDTNLCQGDVTAQPGITWVVNQLCLTSLGVAR